LRLPQVLLENVNVCVPFTVIQEFQIFIPDLLEGYEKLCAAAQNVSPALVDLEVEHLRRFSLTWEVLNKHLYQSIIYTDPLIENNLPIFLSQVTL